MESERTIRRLEEENAMLKEEVSILRDMILDMKFDDVKYLFTTSSKAELMDISHKGSFPFTLEFLQDAGIDIDYAMNYIDQKKDQIEKEARETEEYEETSNPFNPFKELADMLTNATNSGNGK